MKKLTQTLLLSMLVITLLTGCGKEEPSEEGTPEAASVGEIFDGTKSGQGPISSGCPEIYDPICTAGKLTYRNACDAENAGESSWTKGACS